jgi:hypothetical protein
MNEENWAKRWYLKFRRFLLGASLSWTLAPYSIQYRAETDHMLGLIIHTQILGIPVLPAEGTLRLLPYLMPNMLSWRRMTIFDHALEGADLKHLGH